jgi:probable rRNA maturation factor
MPAAQLAAQGSSVRLRAGITHTAASRAVVSQRRLRRIARLALQVAGQEGRFALALAFVTDARMRRLNRQFAGNDYITDVLSFAAREDGGRYRVPPPGEIELGDIVIALPQAVRQARAAGHPLARELDLLVTHGVLHLLGYDHDVPAAARRMDALQAQVLARRGFSRPAHRRGSGTKPYPGGRKLTKIAP